MKIHSITPVQPGLWIEVRIETEKGDSDFDEKFHKYSVIAWAVVDEGDGEERIEPVVIAGHGAPVVFSQLAGQYAMETKNFSDVEYQVVDDKGNVPS